MRWPWSALDSLLVELRQPGFPNRKIETFNDEDECGFIFSSLVHTFVRSVLLAFFLPRNCLNILFMSLFLFFSFLPLFFLFWQTNACSKQGKEKAKEFRKMWVVRCHSSQRSYSTHKVKEKNEGGYAYITWLCYFCIITNLIIIVMCATFFPLWCRPHICIVNAPYIFSNPILLDTDTFLIYWSVFSEPISTNFFLPFSTFRQDIFPCTLSLNKEPRSFLDVFGLVNQW